MNYVNIGNVKIEKTLALAPMAGVADKPFRHLCMEYGASYCVTEMVSSKGLCYSDSKTSELCTISMMSVRVVFSYLVVNLTSWLKL